MEKLKVNPVGADVAAVAVDVALGKLSPGNLPNVGAAVVVEVGVPKLRVGFVAPSVEPSPKFRPVGTLFDQNILLSILGCR